MAMTRFFVIDAMASKSSISTVPVWLWQFGFSKYLQTIGDASRTRLKNRHEAALLLQVSFHAKRRNRHHRKNSSARIEHRDPYIGDAHHLRTGGVIEAVFADFLQM